MALRVTPNTHPPPHTSTHTSTYTTGPARSELWHSMHRQAQHEHPEQRSPHTHLHPPHPHLHAQSINHIHIYPSQTRRVSHRLDLSPLTWPPPLPLPHTAAPKLVGCVWRMCRSSSKLKCVCVHAVSKQVSVRPCAVRSRVCSHKYKGQQHHKSMGMCARGTVP